MPIRRSDHLTRAGQGRGMLGLSMLLALMLAACGGVMPEATPSPPPPPTPIPTEIPSPPPTAPEPTPEPPYDFMQFSALSGKPQDSPEATFELYLRDALSQTESIQQRRLALRLRYESHPVTEADFGGLVVGVRLLEDRSTLTMPNDNTAIYMAVFDVLVTFADQSTAMRYCDWSVTLEQARGSWYVINPSELPLFSVCRV